MYNVCVYVYTYITCKEYRDPIGVVASVVPFNFPAMVPAVTVLLLLLLVVVVVLLVFLLVVVVVLGPALDDPDSHRVWEHHGLQAEREGAADRHAILLLIILLLLLLLMIIIIITSQ